jgi:uncharacterized protein (TIGR00730 family)
MTMQEPTECPTPKKAYNSFEFLNSHEARSIRVLCELIEPERRLKAEKVQHTVVMFGSARSVDSRRASVTSEGLLGKSALEQDPVNRKRLEEQADYTLRLARYYDDAVELSRRITEWSLGIPREEDRFYICSGGGPGMMEAANRGAWLAGGKSLGLGISLPFEQQINPYCTPELSFEYHYFFLRKYWFLYLAKALVVFPGGFGTMDELFEMLTLIQTRKSTKPLPIILFGKEFWNDILNFDAFRKWGVISESDLKLFRMIDSVDEAFDYLVDELGDKPLYHSF